MYSVNVKWSHIADRTNMTTVDTKRRKTKATTGTQKFRSEQREDRANKKKMIRSQI